MTHKTLSAKKRYSLFFITLICLIGIGSVLLRSWNYTPDMHFVDGLELLNENPRRAISHLVMAQKSQDSEIRLFSALHLASLYHHGAKDVPVNMAKAVFYYEEAARLKSPKALYTLALLYDAGDKVKENREKAKDYMTKAAQTMPEAKYALAVWIERGYFGEPDEKKAVALYEQAACDGIQNAIKSLISIYHGGFGGFPKNIEREQYWRTKLK